MSSIGQTALPEKGKGFDMQRSNPRLILETAAMAAMVILLLYVLFGPPT
jgi:hypothetical protein